MTLAAFILLDTGAIVFNRSAAPRPGAVLVALGAQKDLPRQIFAAARVEGARVTVPGYDPAAAPAARMIAIERFLTVLAGRPVSWSDFPPAEGPPAACGRPSLSFEPREVFDKAHAAAGREARQISTTL